MDAKDRDRFAQGETVPLGGDSGATVRRVPLNPLTHDTYNALRDIRADVQSAIDGNTPVSESTLDAIDGVMDVVHDALPEHWHDEDADD